MTVTVSLLKPASVDGNLEVSTVLRQLGLLWKYNLLEFTENDVIDTGVAEGPLFIDLSVNNPTYEKAVASVIEEWPGLCILFINGSLVFSESLRSIAGIKRIFRNDQSGDLSITKVSDDILISGIDLQSLFFDFNERKIWNIDTKNAEPLLQDDAGQCFFAKNGRVYTLSFPCWQFGIVSFPDWFKIIENVIFFSNDIPHVSPGPYVAFRIDDIPLTGESYIKQGYADSVALGEIREIQKAKELYGAKLEYMMSSHILEYSGDAQPVTTIAGKSIDYIRSLFERDTLNIGVHGYLHMNASKYQNNGEIFPREFLLLGETETYQILKNLKSWLHDDFGKQEMGFVAPAWGYKKDITKPAGRERFNYIADSNQHLQEDGHSDLFGSVVNGCVNMYETWRSGMSGICMASKSVFSGFLDVGLPVHLMLHGSLVSDPLKKSHKLLIIIFSILFCSAVAVVTWLFLGMPGLSIALIVFSGFGFGVVRKRKYLGWLVRQLLAKLDKRIRIRDIAKEGKRAGAKWMYVEEMAMHMKSYDSLSVETNRIVNKMGDECIDAIFDCGKGFSSAISLHFPSIVQEVIVHSDGFEVEKEGKTIHVGPLNHGVYNLTVRLCS